MGSISFSIPKALVQVFIESKPIDNFIETGTHKGGTTFWAAKHFKNVYTIEIDEAMSKSTASAPHCPPNIEFLVGNSKVILPQLVERGLEGNCLFWLDGHWCFVGGGKEEECPLMEELDAIRSMQHSILMIDDARCFLGKMPRPFKSEHWPRIDEIFKKLEENFPNHRVTIFEDVILAIPPDYLPAFDQYWQRTFFERYSNKSQLWKFLRRIKKRFLK
jgi:hypothetical protein